MKIVTSADINTESPSEVQAKLWTAIIPAAGRGSRLGHDQPKILYPINGRSILDWLIDLLGPFCQNFVFVLSPDGASQVEPKIAARLAGRFEIVLQAEPLGMADAISQALPHLHTPQALIIWGDQVAIRPETIRDVLKIQQSSAETKLTLPIVNRPEPYTHYQTNAEDELTDVLEKREGATLPSMGRSDCGVFAATTQALQAVFQATTKKGIPTSPATKEWNFLPMIPQFETGGASVVALELDSLAETVGVNDKNDVALLETHFQQLHHD